MVRKYSSTKSKRKTARRCLLASAFICISLTASAAPPQTQPSPKNQQQQGLIYSVKGPDLFRDHCASCHGMDAKGGGPAAPALKANVPDLTVLAKNNGGQFPAARVRREISGEQVVISHGTREMPIFGPVFHNIEPYESLNPNTDLAKMRLDNVVAYLLSIQVK